MKAMCDKQKKCGRKSFFESRNLIQTTFQAFSDMLSSADIFKNKKIWRRLMRKFEALQFRREESIATQF